jgi:predicted transcriptional regulator YdeE
MKPEIVQRPEVTIAGVMNCGKGVEDIDIHRLWQAYEKAEPGIPSRLEEWYEVHIGTDLGAGIYSVFAGVVVPELGNLPVEVCVKVIPAGQYAHFAHVMKNGGYDGAFRWVGAWVKDSGAKTADFSVQLYDNDFNPSDENSVLHVYIPLVS